jgi:hypothetical protein
MSKLLLALVFASLLSEGEALSDQQIAAAIAAGSATPAKKLWDRIKKGQRIRINRAFGDSVEKFATFVTDSDRIALVVADRSRRRMPPLSVPEAKALIPLGRVEVRLEAKANGIYALNVRKWCAPEVHMILHAGGEAIQPISETSGGISRNVILPSETGIVTRNGPFATYTPLYQSALYDTTTGVTWFAFPNPPGGRLSIVVISADGHSKERTITGLEDRPLRVVGDN